MKPLPQSLKNEILDAHRKTGESARSLAKRFGVHHKTSARIIKGTVSTPEMKEQHEVKSDSWVISIPKTRICTLDELVEHCKIDLGIWEIERFVANKWEVGARDESGKIVVEPLFQIKAFLRKRQILVNIRAEIEALKLLAKSVGKLPKECKPRKLTGLMLELNCPDIHLGKLSWGEETNAQNYDTKIGVETFWRAFDTMLGRVKGFVFEQILFVVGNDLLNADDKLGRTTAGTPQSTDGRYQKTFVTARNMNVQAIERLRELGPVRVVMIPGNHDTLSLWCLGDSLECYFHTYSDVEIDNSPKPRKYFRFGDVLLMFTHGDKSKTRDIPLLMATEEPILFGSTKFREAHTGHFHQSKEVENHGVKVRILPALCPPDAWHSEMGYTGNLRSAESYVWSKTEGLITKVFYNEVD